MLSSAICALFKRCLFNGLEKLLISLWPHQPLFLFIEKQEGPCLRRDPLSSLYVITSASLPSKPDAQSLHAGPVPDVPPPSALTHAPLALVLTDADRKSVV